jgi:hypothetical protein
MLSVQPVRVFLAALLALSAHAGRAGAAEPETLAIRYDHGTPLGDVAISQARREGSTIVDLSDSFVPNVLVEEPARGELGSPAYANTYRALADERYDAAGVTARARDERFLELYGIFPTFRVLRERVLDEARQACHAGVDLAPLRTYTGPLSVAQSPSEARRAATAVVQQILQCDDLLPASHVRGVFDYTTLVGLKAFQRRHMIVSGGALDATTRAQLLEPSIERDFEAVLRGLRERVVAATGLIEDGSASCEQAEVVGRRLDSPEFRKLDARGPLAHGAPDLVGRATDAAARALGWTTAQAAKAWFSRTDAQTFQRLHVALTLPELPAYHSAHMELRAEIDRGDVWYEYPYRPDGSRRAQPVEQRPTLVLYARTSGGEVPLIRWNTTIGGFQPEQLADGRVVLRYKNSEPGARVWRELIAAPSWLPPDSTPDRELVSRVGRGRYALKRDVFGPGFASAYGLVMLQHDRELPSDAGAPRYADTLVRSHGSVNYRSILNGQSHGCHRLFNHLALRLASFLLLHRDHVHHGMLQTRYARRVHYQNVHQTLRIESRGYGYELTPPVPLVVTEGRMRGRRKRPVGADLPLPPGLLF